MPVHRQRFESALEGGVETPPVAGMSFLPPDVLEGSDADDGKSSAELLAQAVVDLRLDFAFVPATAQWAEEAVKLLAARGRAALWVVDGPFWRAVGPADPIEGLKATVWDPARLTPRLDAETVRAQMYVMRGGEIGADAVVIADDLAGSNGPLVSPDYVNEYLVERYALLVASAASTGLRAVFHTDGDMRAFMPSIARAGFIGVHSGGGLRQEGFEKLLLSAREHGLALLGGIDTDRLREGSDSAMRMGTRAGVLASGGGLLVADDGGITTREEIAALTAALGSAGVGA